MQRAISAVARSSLTRAARFNSTPAWVKPQYVELFKSNLDKLEYPEKAVDGEHLVFSKLMYQIAKAEGKEEKYLSDLQTLKQNAKQLSRTWRTSSNVAEDKEFQEMEPGVRFVLRWMQTSAQMERLEDVTKIFAIYVKAAKKTMVVPVTLAGLPETQQKNVDAAKKAAQTVLSTRFPDKKDWKLEFDYVVDPGIIDGWRLEVGSLVVEDMSAYLSTFEKAAGASAQVDYTAVPVAKPLATEWPLNAGVEMFSDWCDELTTYDMEEAKFG
eukprot:gene10268-15792_t